MKLSGVSAIKSILGLYRDKSSQLMEQSYRDFSKSIIKTSEDYYHKTAQEYMEAGISIFLPKAKKFYEDETKRIDIGFESDIGDTLKELLQKIFKKDSIYYVEDNLQKVIETDRDEDWAGIVTLFSDSPSFDKLILSVKDTMLNRFKETFNKKFKETQSIDKDFMAVCDVLFSNLEYLKHKKEISFEKNEKLSNIVDAAFKESIINNDITEKNPKKDHLSKGISNICIYIN